MSPSPPTGALTGSPVGPLATGEVLGWLDEKPTLARTVAAVRRLDALAGLEPGRFAERRALLVRNFTLEPIEPLLRIAAYRAGIALALSWSGYEPGGEPPEAWAAVAPDVVFLALRLEELSPALSDGFLDLEPGAARSLADAAGEQVASLVGRLRAATGATVIVHNFALPRAPAAGLADAQDRDGQLNLVRSLNVRIAELAGRSDGVHVLDVDHLFARLGHDHLHDERGARTADSPLNQTALRALADSMARHLRALAGPAIKLLVLDCDNTLWGGVVGEDGVGGIVLGPTGAGRRFHDFQRRLLDLRRRGVVLAIASKNEPADVLAVLRSHPDCLLGEDDFAATRIDWADKATSIEAIAGELGLGLRHVAFLDDNPVECEWVRERLPEVSVIHWPDDLPSGVPDELALFDSLELTGEDRARTEMYRSEGGRRAARQAVVSVEDYLRSLEMVATVGVAGPEHLPRLAQLTAKTNQFNLTTRRHDLAALERLAASPDAALIWLSLEDRFGASGTIGCGIAVVEGDRATIDTLLLSCRVIGRHAEDLLVARLASFAAARGASALIGEYLPTDRNGQVADYFPRLGFTAVPEPQAGNGGRAVWQWSLSGGLPPVPDWFEVVEG